MKRFTIDLHGPLHGIDYGGQGGLVLLIHGLSGSAVNWCETADKLTAYGRVIAPEMPGFGRTPPAGRKVSMSAQARIMADFIEYQNRGPALIIGNSMGALIGMILAGERPDLAERLVLINPPAPSPSLEGLSRPWIVTMLLYMVPGISNLFLKRLLNHGPPEPTTDRALDQLAGASGRMSATTKQLHAQVARERHALPWPVPVHLAAFRSVMSYMVPYSRFTRTARRVKAPTLQMHGTEDRVVPINAAERLAAIRPDWSYRPLVGVGHIPMLEAPGLVLDLVAEFMEQTGERIVPLRRGSSSGTGPIQETIGGPGVGDPVSNHPSSFGLQNPPRRLIHFPGVVGVGGDDEEDRASLGLE